MSITITSWKDGSILFTAEVENLEGANLYGAYLRRADLYGANLRSAYLRSANLRSANLEGANLYGADLRRADLEGANLYGANLRRADLEGANLYGANLRRADLRRANLRRADLRRANLEGANLEGATGGVSTITGLRWFVCIYDDRMSIGCENHAIEEWRVFDDDRIRAMDPRALKFWKVWKYKLMVRAEEIRESEPVHQKVSTR